MPFLPLDQATVFSIAKAPDGALLFPISYSETVLKAHVDGHPAYIELDGDQPFFVRAINGSEHELGLAVVDYVIELDSATAYHGSDQKNAGDFLFGDGWTGIYAKTRPGERMVLRLTGDRVTNPIAGYRNWRIVQYAQNGERTILFEKAAPPHK